MKLEVGQKLWRVSSQKGREGREVRITKVGRKWAEIENFFHDGKKEHSYPVGRINIATLAVDSGGYSVTDQCYESREVYEKIVELTNAWGGFVQAVRNCRQPEGITLEKIEAARALLFGEEIKPQGTS